MNYLTVGELIERLKVLNSEAICVLEGNENGFKEVQSVVTDLGDLVQNKKGSFIFTYLTGQIDGQIIEICVIN